MKKLIILGASGNIGSQTLDIVRGNKNKFKVVGISVGKDLVKASEIIAEFNPEFVVARSIDDAKELGKQFSMKISYGDSGLIELATYKKHSRILLVSALVGSVGLIPTYEAIKIGRDVALANKETLVTAGNIIMSLAKEKGVKIMPIDSEHSAIYQCLSGEKHKNVSKLIITASGGALRDENILSFDNVTKENVLAHPNWNMGKKITIDCATMMNKGFEVIEAHYLFDIPYDNIKVLIHRESIIHSMVQFKDSSIKAQMANPDMRMPICYALSDGERINYNNELNLVGKNLSFNEVDYNRYPCFKLALEAARKGNIYPTVLNASNEAAVNLFLNDKIKFTDIYKIVKESIDNTKKVKELSIDLIVKTDRIIKDQILEKYKGVGLC